MEKINKPVRVILCGAGFGFNTDYFELARKTGGSVHTIESDIFNLTRLNEGETIKIGTYTYKIIGGKFIQMFSS